ncbi:uncharacterized protein LOC119089958 [Pollicipes pollicipes]|uniref:uncharacterized protein LOC119089958 n=1 Tax=Pollicipes pollicipes TaxID=41117 RepID=UPI001884937A|nr:uncharacterized protein LOC119089958 [Pollicipes pollicipes]
MARAPTVDGATSSSRSSGSQRQPAMRTAKWYMCVFLVAFLYFYVMLIKQVRGAELPPSAEARQAGGRAPPDYDPQFSDGETDAVGFSYHDHEQLTAYLRRISTEYPEITALYSVGKSVQGRDLWVLVVSSSPFEHMIGKPNVKYVGNIHGNEAVGREVLIHLIEYLVRRHNSDPYVRWLLDNTRVHIMPSMNPDGFEVSREGACEGGQGRFNSLSYDLNRNFPDYFKTNNKKSQQETDAVKEWINKIQFVLSAQLHGGALVASYPFDNTPNSKDGNAVRKEPVFGRQGRAWYDPFLQPLQAAVSEPVRVLRQFSSTESRSPDDDTMRHLAKVYSFNHLKMHKGAPCPGKLGADRFKDGITNGAKWYPLTGGMQDFNYVWHGCMALTLALSCCKYPPASQLRSFWHDNRKALVKFVAESHRGVRGFVTDRNNNPIEGAALKVQGRNVGFQTTQHGEFWRILLPGTYVMEVFAEGYYPREQQFSVREEYPTELTIAMDRVPDVNRQDFTQPPIAPPPPTPAPSGIGGLWTRIQGGFQSHVKWWRSRRTMFKFHSVHGSHVSLENDDTCASRREGFCNGITFSSGPLLRGEQYHLRLTQVTDWNGAVRVGVTWHDPATLTSLPRYSFPDLIRRPGFWVRTVREQHLRDGARVHFWLTEESELHVSVNHRQVTRLATGVPADRPLWALIDVYGNTQAVQITCDEPEEIEEEYQTAIARNVVRELLKDRKSREMAKLKNRSSSRSFSSTFRVTDEGALKELPADIGACGSQRQPAMRTAKWYMCVFLVAFLYFYVMLIKQVRGAELPPSAEARQAGGRAPPDYDPQFSDGETDAVGFSYHDHEQLTAYLRRISTEYPEITALYSVGKSVASAKSGRDLWVLVVSSSPFEHMIGKPNVKYVGNIHGNEAVGREVLIHLIEYLVRRHNSDPYVRWLLDNTRVHIMPSMNPDGFEVSREGACEGGQGRFNSLSYDLNRNFPDYFKTNNKKSQQETDAVKEWINKIQFVLSAQLHGGALVASYPFDNTPNSKDGNAVRKEPVFGRQGRAWYDPFLQPLQAAVSEPVRVLRQFSSTESRSPDDDTMRHLAKVYSFNHLKMHKGAPCPGKLGADRFKDGITNGAKWYPLTGGMQDFNYVWHGCMELTLELSCCKYPPASQLRSFWHDNRKALVKFVAESHRGVRGFVTDRNNNPIEGAALKVQGRNVGFQTTQHGEFWRILLPGTYVMEVFAEGYYPREQQFSVREEYPTELTIAMDRVPDVNRQDFTQPPIAPPPPTPAPSGIGGLWTRIQGGFQSLFG